MNELFKLSDKLFFLISAIIVLFVIGYFLALIKKDPMSIEKILAWPPALVFCIVAVVITLFDFIGDTKVIIPGQYNVTTSLSIADNKYPYSVVAKIECDEDEHNEKSYYWLIDYSFYDFEFEHLPEEVESNSKYEVSVWLYRDKNGKPTIEGENNITFPTEATIHFPAFTKENLELSQPGISNNYNIFNAVIHCLVFAFGFFGMILCIRKRL